MSDPRARTAGELGTLLAVQEHDLHLDQLAHRRANLPARAELAALLSRRSEVANRREEAGRVRDEVLGRQQQLEADLAAAEERIGAIDKRMFSGAVTASRDLTAMAGEIESLKTRVSSLEDGALEVMDEREPLDLVVAELDAELAAIDEAVTRVIGAIAIGEAELDGEVAVEQRTREGLAAVLSQELSATYEGLRAKHGGIGAARLDGNRCAGCHLTLPATELDRIRHLPPGTLVFCDQCGRILVRDD